MSKPLYTEIFPEGEWFRYDFDLSESQFLTWKEGCGWFDCNKSPEYNENDGNLCWAAAASNLLIWWMVNNKAYIEAYDKEFGSEVTSTKDDRVFSRPSDEFKPLLYIDGSVNRAPVFEFFKSSFPNRGGWASAGVNWFINGEHSYKLLSPNFQGFPGFFHNVFQKTDVIAVDSRNSPNCELFNKFIIDALSNKRALEFGVFDIAGTGTGTHAMIIWGAEFDEVGIISHIYYCDNNYADQDANGAVIKRARIVYGKDTTIPNSTAECTYMAALPNEAGIIPKNFKITSLSSADLRQDIWQKKYPSIKPN